MKKKLLFTITTLLIVFTLVGCGTKKNENEISKTKDNMVNNLDNFTVNATITAQTGIIDVNVDVKCKIDNKNKIEYCKTSTLGIIDNEQYIDFKNKKMYTKTTTLMGGDANNGKWVSAKYNESQAIGNSWLSLNDYLSDLNVTEQNGEKVYTGKINSKKLNEALTKSDSSSKVNGNIKLKNVPIEIHINKDGYLSSTKAEFEIAGMKEIVNIRYSNFNTTGDIVIPSDIK